MLYVAKGSDSDVAVRRTSEGYECEECRLTGGVEHVTFCPADMIDHLHEHIRSSHTVPAAVLERLYDEGGDHWDV